MNPLLALLGVGWLVLRAVANKDAAQAGAGLPPPRGVVTIGQPRIIKALSAGKPAAKAAPKPVARKAPKPAAPAARVPARPVPPAPQRTPQQAARPVKPKPQPTPTAKQAEALARARAAMPPTPAAARAKIPAPPGTDIPKAKKMAAQVATNLRKGMKLYDRNLLKAFQRACGLAPDGLYGPVARSALSYFGIASPPAPMFAGQDLKYVPPGE